MGNERVERERDWGRGEKGHGKKGSRDEEDGRQCEKGESEVERR